MCVCVDLIALLWIFHTHRHTNSAKPYGQMMNIMRNTSEGSERQKGNKLVQVRRGGEDVYQSGRERSLPNECKVNT